MKTMAQTGNDKINSALDLDGVTEVESADLQALMRGGAPTERKSPEESEREVDAHVEELEREPTLKVEDEKEEDDKSVDPHVAKALESIARVEGRLDEIGGRRDGEPTRGPQRGRPDPSDYEEVAPGLKLPKNKDLWPVRVTPEMVEAIGLDPAATAGLNILGNGLIQFVLDNLPGLVDERVGRTIDTRKTVEAEHQTFFDKYHDLKGHDDILELTEMRVRREVELGSRPRWRDRQEYADLLGKEARRRIASLRGQSLEDYESGLTQRGDGERSKTTTTRTTSRAVTTGSGGGTRRGGGAVSDMDSLVDEHLGR